MKGFGVYSGAAAERGCVFYAQNEAEKIADATDDGGSVGKTLENERHALKFTVQKTGAAL